MRWRRRRDAIGRRFPDESAIRRSHYESTEKARIVPKIGPHLSTMIRQNLRISMALACFQTWNWSSLATYVRVWSWHDSRWSKGFPIAARKLFWIISTCLPQSYTSMEQRKNARRAEACPIRSKLTSRLEHTLFLIQNVGALYHKRFQGGIEIWSTIWSQWLQPGDFLETSIKCAHSSLDSAYHSLCVCKIQKYLTSKTNYIILHPYEETKEILIWMCWGQRWRVYLGFFSSIAEPGIESCRQIGMVERSVGQLYVGFVEHACMNARWRWGRCVRSGGGGVEDGIDLTWLVILIDSWYRFEGGGRGTCVTPICFFFLFSRLDLFIFNDTYWGCWRRWGCTGTPTLHLTLRNALLESVRYIRSHVHMLQL